jgi:hypothetical protein
MDTRLRKDRRARHSGVTIDSDNVWFVSKLEDCGNFHPKEMINM